MKNELAEAYSDMIRKICFEFSAGGYNSEGLMPPEVADDKLRFIIDDNYKAGQFLNKLQQGKLILEIYDLKAEVRELEAELRSAHKEIDYLNSIQGDNYR